MTQKVIKANRYSYIPLHIKNTKLKSIIELKYNVEIRDIVLNKKTHPMYLIFELPTGIMYYQNCVLIDTLYEVMN